MKITLNYGGQASDSDVLFLGAFAKGKGIELPQWTQSIKKAFQATPGAEGFSGKKGALTFYHDGHTYIALGLGIKKDFQSEELRRAVAKSYREAREKYSSIGLHMDSLSTGTLESATQVASEAILLADYQFDCYLSQENKAQRPKEVFLISAHANSAKFKKALDVAQKTAASVNIARHFIDRPPNVLRSSVYAKEIVKDVRNNLQGCGVHSKVLGKKELKNEKMGLFLSVNVGSAFEPQLVHLTYTPKKPSKKTKHVALVGKGVVFDTGGYSLKPPMALIGMKYDMAGSATVYGAFRAAALLGVDTKITCILGITDNAVDALAIMPDSIVKGRNGKTVEIVNTDAEGRLVLADCLDYACDQKPDYLIDVATLTGACLIALGNEVCGLMSNEQSLADQLLKSAREQGEYLWQLPIIKEFQKDMKSQIADLRNLGHKQFAGTAKGAAFLQEFVREGIPWAHLDIAGISKGQAYLPYCPAEGPSGLIVRSLLHFIRNV